MKNWIIKYKNEILVGVICSIIVAVIMKAGTILALFLPRAGNTLWGSFVDYIYYRAAIQSSVSLLGNIFPEILAVLFASFIVFLIKTFRTISKVETVDKVLKAVEKHDSEDKNIEELQEAKKELEKLEKKEKRRPSTKATKVLAIILLLWGIYFFVWNATCVYYPVKLWHDYQIDITQISPYITEQKEKMLNSQWVSMKSKADYDVIYQVINQTKEDCGL